MSFHWSSLSSPRLLATHRQTAVILEHARVSVDDGRVVYTIAESGDQKVFNIPIANVAILFLGKGTSMTDAAAMMLAQEHVFVAFTGSGGSPLHFGHLVDYEITTYLWDMVRVAQQDDLSLEAAKIIMRSRIDAMQTIATPISKEILRGYPASALDRPLKIFARNIEKARSTREIMGHEGDFARAIYAAFAAHSGHTGFKRTQGKGVRDDRNALANSRIDHGNYIAYGIAGAAICGMGIPRGMSVLHGKTRSGGLVFDLADSFKDALVLPFAFSGIQDDTELRQRLIAAIQDHQLLSRAFATLKEITELGKETSTIETGRER